MTLHIVFNVAGAEYALAVAEILQMESFAGATPVPGALPFVVGVVTVRGRVVPVIDLRLRFGLPPADDGLETRIAVTQTADRVVALRVDSAREVLDLDIDKLQPVPKVVADRSRGFVHSVHPLGPRLLLLLDLPQVLGDPRHDDEPRALLDDDGSRGRRALTR